MFWILRMLARGAILLAVALIARGCDRAPISVDDTAHNALEAPTALAGRSA